MEGEHMTVRRDPRNGQGRRPHVYFCAIASSIVIASARSTVLAQTTPVSDRALLNALNQAMRDAPQLRPQLTQVAQQVKPNLTPQIQQVASAGASQTSTFQPSTLQAAPQTASVPAAASTGLSTGTIVGAVAGVAAVAAGAGIAIAGGQDSSTGETQQVTNETKSPFETEEYSRMGGMETMNAAAAYDRGITGAGVVIGVLTNGMDYENPDLIENLAPGAKDFVDGDDDPRHRLDPGFAEDMLTPIEYASGNGTEIVSTICRFFFVSRFGY